MRIGFFCNEYPPSPHGGIGSFVGMLAQTLAQGGHEITVAQFGKSASIKIQDGVRVVTLPESSTQHVAWLINRIRLWQWLRNEVLVGRIEIFEIPEYQGCMPFPFSACPIVVRLHLAESLVRHIMKTGGIYSKVYFLEKLTLYWHRNWIGVSRYILSQTKSFFAIAPRVNSVIYNPAPDIDQNKLPVLSERPESYVVYVGSVSERKGALQLAEAMREVFTINPDIYLVYVGPQTEYLGDAISFKILTTLNAYKNRVIFTGRVSHEHALAWLSNARALVFVSKIESFGLVATEAMSLSVPVICAATGPGPELVCDGVNGLLISPDSSDDLAKAILRLIDNPSWALELCSAAHHKVLSKFTLQGCVTSSLEYYQHLQLMKNGN